MFFVTTSDARFVLRRAWHRAVVNAARVGADGLLFAKNLGFLPSDQQSVSEIHRQHVV
jgi:hypothetical protein